MYTRIIISALIVLISSSFAFAGVIIKNGLTHERTVYDLSPYEGIIRIQNTSNVDERILIYQRDLHHDCANDVIFTPAGTSERSNAKWITLATEEKVLAPGEEYDLKYYVTPAGGSLKGSYWSALFIEVTNPIDTAQVATGLSVNTHVRYAIQLITHFETLQEANAEFDSVAIYEDKGMSFLDVYMKNESISLLKPKITLELYTESGELAHEVSIPVKKLYPFNCRIYTLPLEEVEAAKYEAVLIADCKENGLFGINISLDLQEE